MTGPDWRAWAPPLDPPAAGALPEDAGAADRCRLRRPARDRGRAVGGVRRPAAAEPDRRAGRHRLPVVSSSPADARWRLRPGYRPGELAPVVPVHDAHRSAGGARLVSPGPGGWFRRTARTARSVNPLSLPGLWSFSTADPPGGPMPLVRACRVPWCASTQPCPAVPTRRRSRSPPRRRCRRAGPRSGPPAWPATAGPARRAAPRPPTPITSSRALSAAPTPWRTCGHCAARATTGPRARCSAGSPSSLPDLGQPPPATSPPCHRPALPACAPPSPPGWPACLRSSAPPGLASCPPATRSAPARCAPRDRSCGSLTRVQPPARAGPRGTIFRPGQRSPPGQRPGPGRRNREQPCSCPAQLDRDRPAPTRRTAHSPAPHRPHTRPARGPQRSHRTEPQGHERSHATRSKDKDHGPSRCLSARRAEDVGGGPATSFSRRVLRSRVLAAPGFRSSR